MTDYYKSSPRFCGLPTFMRLPEYATVGNAAVGIVGIPFDNTSSYRTGSRFAPRSIREISTTLKRYNRNLDIDVFKDSIAADWGDLEVIPGYITESFDRITAGISGMLEKNTIPIAIGGDHGIVLPELRAHKAKWGKTALLSFDAHRDCSNKHFGQPYGHGTSFRRAAEEGLIDPCLSTIIGVRGSGYSPDDYKIPEELGFKIIDIDAFYAMGMEETIAFINRRTGNNKCFVSFDMDVVDPAFAPGTNTPECGGITAREALLLVRKLTELDIIGCDLVEVNPQYDNGNITSLLASSLIFELISLILKRLKRE